MSAWTLSEHHPAGRRERQVQAFVLRNRPQVGDPAPGADEPALPAAIGEYLVAAAFRRPVRRRSIGSCIRDWPGTWCSSSPHPIEPGGRHEIIEEGKILADLKHPICSRSTILISTTTGLTW